MIKGTKRKVEQKAFLNFKFEIKEDHNEGDVMTFRAYANVKHVKDHAWDICVDGCYQASVDSHKLNGTMPRLLWSHNARELPVGTITNMGEDSKGLWIEGFLSTTTKGIDIYKLLKSKSLDSFSIGYSIVKEEWSEHANANLLIEIHIKEVSFVNFACNEMSLLQDVKSALLSGDTISKEKLTAILLDYGLHDSVTKSITDNYTPSTGDKESALDKDECILKSLEGCDIGDISFDPLAFKSTDIDESMLDLLIE